MIRQVSKVDGVRKSEDRDTSQEASWIEASRKGDTAAFNHLVQKWETTVFNLALRMLQDGEEAADVCQEVFLSAFRNIRRFQRRSRFSTWLYRIASNKCLTRLKRSPRRGELPLEGTEGTKRMRGLSLVENQDRLIWERERRGQILKALRGLTDEQRIVVEMRIYQDRKFDEIAEILDLPSSTVKSRFYSSLSQLKDELAPLAARG